MSHIATFLLFLLTLVYSSLAIADNRYPALPTDKDNQKCYDHGGCIPAPYQYLEAYNTRKPDDHPRGTEIQKWIEDQKQLTASVLPETDVEKMNEKLSIFRQYKTISPPLMFKEFYHYQKKEDGKPYPALYRTSKEQFNQSPSNPGGKLLLDFNSLQTETEEPTYGWWTQKATSNDGSKILIGVYKQKAKFESLRIFNFNTQTYYNETLEGSGYGDITWHPSNNSVFYSFHKDFDTPEASRAEAMRNYIYSHTPGTPQSEDILIFPTPAQEQQFQIHAHEPDKRFIINLHRLSSDKKYLIVESTYDGSPLGQTQSFYAKITENLKDLVFHQVFKPKKDVAYNFIGNIGPHFYYKTNDNAPKWKVVKFNISLRDPRPETILESNTIGAIKSAFIFRDRIITIEVDGIKSYLNTYNAATGKKITQTPAPKNGQFTKIKLSKFNDNGYFSVESYTLPQSLYHFKPNNINNTLTKVYEPSIPSIDMNDYTSISTFYQSRDNTTQIPITIIHRKDLPHIKTHPLIVEGYGAHHIKWLPRYRFDFMPWIDAGGIIAVANIRGGSEYGDQWTKAGNGFNRHVKFQDFEDAISFMINKGYTTPEQVGIWGASAGGYLTSTVVTRQSAKMKLDPNYKLFSAAAIIAPVIDTFISDARSTWFEEYGDPRDEDMFNYMTLSDSEKITVPLIHTHAYTPSTSKTWLPSIISMMSPTDDRIPISNLLKVTAAFQQSVTQTHDQGPILMDTYDSATHKLNDEFRQEVASKVLTLFNMVLK